MPLPDETITAEPFTDVMANNAALLQQAGLAEPGSGATGGPFPAGLAPAPDPSIATGLPDYLTNAGAYFPAPPDPALALAGKPAFLKKDGDTADKGEQGKKKKCSSCGAENAADALKCKRCKKPLVGHKARDLSVEHQAVIYNTQGLNLATTGDDGLLWKVACKTGTLALSPGPGAVDIDQPLVLTRELFDDMVLSAQEQAFPYITVPETHANGALENTGYVRAYEVLDRETLLADQRLPEKHRSIIEGDPDDTQYLLAGIEFTEPDVKARAERGSIPDTSIGVKFGYRNKRTGKTYKAAWEHLALTPMPWVDGLVPFGLSQDGVPGADDPSSGQVVDRYVAVYTPTDELTLSSLSQMQWPTETPGADEALPERADRLRGVQSSADSGVVQGSSGTGSRHSTPEHVAEGVWTFGSGVRGFAAGAAERLRDLRGSATRQSGDVSGSRPRDAGRPGFALSAVQREPGVGGEGGAGGDPELPEGFDVEGYNRALAEAREEAGIEGDGVYVPMPNLDASLQVRVSSDGGGYDWDLKGLKPSQVRADAESALALVGDNGKVDLPCGVCISRYENYWVVNDGYEKIAGIREDEAGAMDLAMATLEKRYEEQRQRNDKAMPVMESSPQLPPWDELDGSDTDNDGDAKYSQQPKRRRFGRRKKGMELGIAFDESLHPRIAGKFAKKYGKIDIRDRASIRTPGYNSTRHVYAGEGADATHLGSVKSLPVKNHIDGPKYHAFSAPTDKASVQVGGAHANIHEAVAALAEHHMAQDGRGKPKDTVSHGADAHPRDWAGNLKKGFTGMTRGDTRELASGVKVERKYQGYRVHNPDASATGSKASRSHKSLDSAVQHAMEIDAHSTHADSIGGAKRTTVADATKAGKGSVEPDNIRSAMGQLGLQDSHLLDNQLASARDGILEIVDPPGKPPAKDGAEALKRLQADGGNPAGRGSSWIPSMSAAHPETAARIYKAIEALRGKKAQQLSQDGNPSDGLDLSADGDIGLLPGEHRHGHREEEMPTITVEELLAQQQAELEASQARIAALEADLALSQGTISAQGEQLHTDAVTRRVRQLQAAGYDPALCLAVKNVMLADKARITADEGMNLSVQAPTTGADGKTTTEERKLNSASDIVEYLLSAMPSGGTGNEATRMAGIHTELTTLHASAHESANDEDAKRAAVEALEKQRHPERFDADGKRI